MIKNKLVLVVLLIFAVLTVGIITGCSSGKKDKKVTKYLTVNQDWGPSKDYYGWGYDFIIQDDSPTSSQFVYHVSSSVFAWSRNEDIYRDDAWSIIEFMLVKNKRFFFSVSTYDSKTDEWDYCEGVDIEVSPSDLATVNTDCSITAQKDGEGTITFKYQDFTHEIKFTVVNSASDIPVID